MTMKKIGWEGKLIEYIRGVASSSFCPGTLDCILFSAGAVEAMTGIDYSAKFRGKYKTIKQGQALLKKIGMKDHVEYVASLFDEHPSVLSAHRGDVAIVTDINGEPAVGIVQGENIYVVGMSGLYLTKLETATRAFAI